MVKLIFPILLISLGILSDYHIFHRYINIVSMWRWIWWLPTAVVIGFALYFILFGRGMIQEYNTVNIFLLLIGLFCIPKMVFSVLSFIPKIGEWLGIAGAVGIVWIILWGITYGFTQLRIRHIVYESSSVPKAFDGYRIAQLSDAHTGTFRGSYHSLLQESIDTVNSLHPDLICFVGDIENFSPSELEAHKETFSSLRAKDGVISIMGNHDYSAYINISDKKRAEMIASTRRMQRSFGWTLLENAHYTIHHKSVNTQGVTDTDSIIIVGEENWGKPPFPQYGNLEKALDGLPLYNKRIQEKTGTPPFVIMLSHDPNAWKAHILPLFHPDITLSGHTHGTQFSLFGWSPASMMYEEWGGTYYYDEASTATHPLRKLMLSVSTGIGGNFPFRFNMPREVVIITLKHR